MIFWGKKRILYQNVRFPRIFRTFWYKSTPFLQKIISIKKDHFQNRQIRHKNRRIRRLKFLDQKDHFLDHFDLFVIFFIKSDLFRTLPRSHDLSINDQKINK